MRRGEGHGSRPGRATGAVAAVGPLCLLIVLAAPGLARAQQQPTPTTPPSPTAQPQPGGVASQPGGAQAGPGSAQAPSGGGQAPTSDTQRGPIAPLPQQAQVTFEQGVYNPPLISARNVRVEMGEYVLSGAHVEGSFNSDVLFTGNPTLTYRGQVVTGDVIRFTPRTRAWSVENLHTAVTPDFLRGQVLSPLYLSGGLISGRQRTDPIVGEDIDATTCDRAHPDYLIRAAEIRVEPGKRIILRRAAFNLWGHRLFTLPTFIIPLDRSPRQLRITHPPQVGRSIDEGWFVKSVFNWVAANRVPGLFRLDLMEKKGIGTGADLDWNLARAVGALTLYAIPTSGFARNLLARVNHRQDFGGGVAVSTDNNYQRQSYLGLPQTTTLSSRLTFTRTVLGANTNLSLSRQATDSESYLSRAATGSFSQSLQFGRSVSLNLNADYSRYATSSVPVSGGTSFSQVTQQLTTRLQAEQRAPNYLLQVVANRYVPVGGGSSSFLSGLERLPEVNLTNYHFTQGLLSHVPATFLLSAGRYAEGGTAGFGSQSRTATDRVLAGFDLSDSRFALTRSTDLRVAGGFQQYFYGDGSAQYLVRNNTTLTQRWGRHSGINLAYSYQRPEGGSPFRFDQLGQFHTFTGDIGLLDDRRLQLTARVGYDLAQPAYLGFTQPWQTLSANLLVRPVDWMRFRSLASFDPNTGRMTSVTTDLRFRGGRNLAIDTVARYDPQRHRFAAINGFLDIPVGRDWRLTALLRYNGYLSRFESRNLQIVRDLHCMEASITYIDNPYGFRTDRQIYFQLRIKAFPIFQRFGVGQFGQPIDTGVGEIY